MIKEEAINILKLLFFRFILGCTGSLLLCRLFSSCSKSGLLSSSGELFMAVASFAAERGLGSRASVVVTQRLRSCNLWALVHRINSCGAWA